ncbi:MAG: hypothetical protein AB7I30_03810 [Isosphaeraceae bacterium]
MRTRLAIVSLLALALVMGLLLAVQSRAVPLGVPGEWEWLRVPFGPNAIDLGLAALGCLAFAVFAGAGFRSLTRKPGFWREAGWLSALAVVSVGIQGVVQSGAPVGYGLEKWVIALSQKGSNGYFNVARDEVHDLGSFLAAYPEWIKAQDALHIGTHPPGLVATQALLLRAMEGDAAASRFVVEHAPDSVTQAFRYFDTRSPMPPPQRAALVLTGLVALVCCGLTVVPLHLLARSNLSAAGAWSAAVLWPLLPSAILFQPTADTAFPLVSTAAMALAAWSVRCAQRKGLGLAALCGVSLGLAMQFTLAFLAVGLIVALVILAGAGRTVGEKTRLILATGVGFLSVTGVVWLATSANPWVIWWWNQKNHGRFYDEYPRSYRAWLIANPIELAVAIGLPATLWATLAGFWPRHAPRVSLAALVTLVLLTVSGRNLSEVARLWLPIMPALLVAAGFALERAGAGPKTIGWTVALTATQSLGLQSMIQVVYPVS